VWKVLRETEGERFVPQNKVRDFQGRIAATKNYSLRCSLYFQFKNVLYAIRYLLAIETFAI
jgi:hypothetical protein